LNKGGEATVERVNCGRSICRVELQTQRPDTELGRVLPLLGWRGPASFFEDAGEPGSVTLYLDEGGRRGVQAMAFP